jgi:hypothetical protein
MYMVVRNIMPTDKMSVPFTAESVNTSERGGEGDCVKEGGGEEGALPSIPHQYLIT